ncbi:MAG: hypothetical protein EA394_11280 [Bacteroidia bacterium]|nr:MAG: hypothetical protein EA394_11280 [Bacteroidia bacterium]
MIGIYRSQTNVYELYLFSKQALLFEMVINNHLKEKKKRHVDLIDFSLFFDSSFACSWHLCNFGNIKRP